MATVEQRDTQPSGLGALSNTLDLFNDFKDDKDSDEESFHLPMLDCDDDLDSSISKENVPNTTEKDVPIGETEDEILNKFETTTTPDIDPKIEEKLLDEIDEVCEKKTDKESVEVDSSHKINEINKIEMVEKTKVQSETQNEEINSENQQNDNLLNSSEAANLNVEDIAEIRDDKQEDAGCQKLNKTLISEKEAKVAEDVEPSVELNEQDEPNQAENNTDNTKLENNKVLEEETATNVKDIEEKSKEKCNKMASDVENEDDEKVTSSPAAVDEKLQGFENNEDVKQHENINVESAKEEIPEPQIEDKMEVDVSDINDESETATDKETIPQTTNESEVSKALESESQNKDKDIILKQSNKSSESMDVELPECDTKEKTMSELLDNRGDVEIIPKETINDAPMKEESPQCKEYTESTSLKHEENKIDLSIEKLIEDAGNKPIKFETIKPEETVPSKLNSVEPEKLENSNDSNKNNDCEDDLLDISIIRDADEDNASAIAENAIENHSSEKSDNDDPEEGSEKAENESEMDQDESSLLINDKDDRMDFDDGNSSNLDQENTVSGDTSDSEPKYYDARDSETESNNSSVLKEKTNRINGILDSEKNQTDEVTTEIKDAGSQSVTVDNQDSHKENSVKIGSKRSLSDTESYETTNKKIKLTDTGVIEKKKAKKVKTLVSFEKFMQTKKIEKKLTRSDLEQFCLQKICEAIVHKTDVGELHQTIKKQEVIIENLRKDLQQLTKQTRDLDIVNKKLMNELRAQNGIKKPLVPLKITRSVGLQVKLNIGADNNIRRKPSVTANPRTPNNNNNNANNSPRQRPTVTPNAKVIRQIAVSPRRTPTSTPILSQALQTSRQVAPLSSVLKQTPIRPKPTEPQKPANPGVIDLTDEDDKASKNAATAQVKTANKTTMSSQTKTLNVVQNKTTTKTINSNGPNKAVAIGQVKPMPVGQKVGTPTRTVTTLPQGVRLTSTQVKNGSIAIPASVVTSSAGTTQLMYVVQPTSSLGPVVTSTAGGTQKAVLLNFQSANGVLTSALNGSAVSVIPTKTTNTVQLKTVAAPRKHPAPLPPPPSVPANASSRKPLLPKPYLSIKKVDNGIILQWKMPYDAALYEEIASYQLFAYQETNAAPSTDMWRKVGDVKALALPMACTLTQFADKNKYYFAVRPVDVLKRIGAFSDPEEISL